jgi:hypothetical protein
MNDFLNIVQFLKFPCLSFPKNPFFNRRIPSFRAGSVYHWAGAGGIASWSGLVLVT